MALWKAQNHEIWLTSQICHFHHKWHHGVFPFFFWPTLCIGNSTASTDWSHSDWLRVQCSAKAALNAAVAGLGIQAEDRRWMSLRTTRSLNFHSKIDSQNKIDPWFRNMSVGLDPMKPFRWLECQQFLPGRIYVASQRSCETRQRPVITALLTAYGNVDFSQLKLDKKITSLLLVLIPRYSSMDPLGVTDLRLDHTLI